jgi:hypothetical protein
MTNEEMTRLCGQCLVVRDGAVVTDAVQTGAAADGPIYKITARRRDGSTYQTEVCHNLELNEMRVVYKH